MRNVLWIVIALLATAGVFVAILLILAGGFIKLGKLLWGDDDSPTR